MKSKAETEVLLNSYIEFKIENENLELELEYLKQNYDLKAINYNEKTGQTYKITHEIEDKIINNEEKINKYESIIYNNNLEMRKLENATKVLTQTEKDVIELKYFHSPILSRKDISKRMLLSTVAIDKIKQRAINKMAKFL